MQVNQIQSGFNVLNRINNQNKSGLKAQNANLGQISNPLYGYKESVPFGMANLTTEGSKMLKELNLKRKVNYFAKQLIDKIYEHNSEGAMAVIEEIEKYPAEIKQGLAVFGEEGRTNYIVGSATGDKFEKVLSHIFNWVEESDPKFQEEFMRNYGNPTIRKSVVSFMLDNNMPEAAGKFLKIQAGIFPEEVIDSKIPVEADFIEEIGAIITGSKTLSPEQTIAFLKKYDLSDYIAIVEQHAKKLKFN